MGLRTLGAAYFTTVHAKRCDPRKLVRAVHENGKPGNGSDFV